MFGMLLGTALVVSHWVALAPAVALFAAGTLIRVRAEEALLREAFESEFDAYSRRVPALIPRVR
jgi:protein-S-isoprenylcysteine O-methyltransferase Ste14